MHLKAPSSAELVWLPRGRRLRTAVAAGGPGAVGSGPGAAAGDAPDEIDVDTQILWEQADTRGRAAVCLGGRRGGGGNGDPSPPGPRLRLDRRAITFMATGGTARCWTDRAGSSTREAALRAGCVILAPLRSGTAPCPPAPRPAATSAVARKAGRQQGSRAGVAGGAACRTARRAAHPAGRCRSPRWRMGAGHGWPHRRPQRALRRCWR